MPGHFVPDVAAGLLVAAGFLIGLRVAWWRGFRSALPLQSSTFDRIAPACQLAGTRWKVQIEDRPNRPPGDPLPLWIEWQQVGSRLLGTGSGNEGTAWDIEGVMHGRHVQCLVRVSNASHSRPEVWMLTFQAQQLVGYWINWDQAGKQLGLREMSLTRQSFTASTPMQTASEQASARPELPPPESSAKSESGR